MNDNFYGVPVHQQSIESTQAAKINSVVDGKRYMDDSVLEAEIRELIAKGNASTLPERGRITNQLMTLLYSQRKAVAGDIANHPLFEDNAWPKTHDYFFANLWEITTRKKDKDKNDKPAFCRTDEPLLPVLRAYLKHRITDAEMEQKGFRRETVQSPDPKVKNSRQWVQQKRLDAPIGKDSSQAWGDMLAAPEQNGGYDWVRTLIEEDVTGELRATTMKSQPALNAQKAFLMSLDGYSKRGIAKHFEVSEQAFYSFFTRSCFPLLRRLCLDFL
jgi:hypothetical protein